MLNYKDVASSLVAHELRRLREMRDAFIAAYKRLWNGRGFGKEGQEAFICLCLRQAAGNGECTQTGLWDALSLVGRALGGYPTLTSWFKAKTGHWPPDPQHQRRRWIKQLIRDISKRIKELEAKA